MKKLLLGSLMSLFIVQLNAQQKAPCITDEHYSELVSKNPELKTFEDLSNFQIRQAQQNLRKTGTVRYIPVVFHVIHKWGVENISQQQIQDAIRVLNEDFRKKSGTNGGTSTDPLAVDMEYEFRLAQLDPNGNPTSGVNRLYSPLTDNARDNAKSLSIWDAKKYLNVWIVNTIQNTTGDPNSIVLGYAQFPFMLNTNGSTDGVVLRADQAGVIEIGKADQAGRTLTHEIGHWVGLYHPFQGGCVGNTSASCASQGDQVCDTPPVSTSTSGCPTNRNSCTNDIPELPDLVKNYMDYADGTCMDMYTAGQKTRADASMNSFRSLVYSSSNLAAAGLNTDGTYKTLTASTKKAPYTFGFNSNEINGSGWSTENYTSPGDSGWNVSATATFSGNGAMRARNLFNNRLGGLRNAFVSPSIDISGLSSPSLSFYIAYAKRISASNDRLRIYISNNFGRTEELVKTYTTADMETGTLSTTEFIPSGASQWKKLNIDLSAYKSYTNCRIRFELSSLRGNNIYIDEFSIAEPTGISDEYKNSIGFSFYPNPSNGKSFVGFKNTLKQNIELSIFDISGKLILKENRIFEEGEQSLEINTQDWSNGVYLLQMKTKEGLLSHRILKN